MFKNIPSGLNKNEPKRSGFSLVELLVVVAILAILAAIAIPLFLNQRSKAAQGAVQSDARNIATELTTVFANLPAGITTSTVTSDSITINNQSIELDLSPNVSITKTTAPDPANGAGVKITYADLPNYACAIPIPPKVQYAWYTSMQPQCGTIVSEVGNLLTFEQYNPQALGAWYFSSEHVTEISPGVYTSLKENHWVTIYRSLSVTANETYTLKTEMSPKEMGARAVFYYLDAQYNNVTVKCCGNVIKANETGISTLITTAPSNATSVALYPHHTESPVTATSVGPWAVKRVGFWEGDGGNLAPPGVPIVEP